MPKGKIRNNPFYQPARQWQISIFSARDLLPQIESAFEDIALAILNFEVAEDGPEWRTDIITATDPQKIGIGARLALISGAHKTPLHDVKLLDTKDWVMEVEQNFPPLSIGRFYIHGSHVKTTAPPSTIALQINAGMAFGSGEHATTSGCLVALETLAKRRRFLRPLDMGCGSGILALAMAKLWRVPVMGIDIDPVSVVVAKNNARKNHIGACVHFAASDGFASNIVKKCAPYDLIVANILARPLIRMAPLLVRNLAKDGVVVVSGLLTWQAQAVLCAYRLQGLKLSLRINRSGWSTLVMRH